MLRVCIQVVLFTLLPGTCMHLSVIKVYIFIILCLLIALNYHRFLDRIYYVGLGGAADLNQVRCQSFIPCIYPLLTLTTIYLLFLDAKDMVSSRYSQCCTVEPLLYDHPQNNIGVVV